MTTQKMDHQQGQYRAELFDELIERILTAMYPGAQVTNKRVLRLPHEGTFRSVSIDFWVKGQAGDVLVETKAPYTSTTVDIVRNSLNRLRTVVELLSSRSIPTFILAIPIAFPQELLEPLAEVNQVAASNKATVKVWDEAVLRKLTKEHLAAEIDSFSINELQQVLGIKTNKSILAPTAGLRSDVTVLMADFCSFTSFVQATYREGRVNPDKLIDSIMGRFYRVMRQAIEDHDGFLDKYMGDGILAYWFGEGIGPKFESCIERLMGNAVNLAEEWEDELDSLVEPKGLRAGAAMGQIFFVEENQLNPPTPPIHAIGYPINIAARLQAKADPNSLVITQNLRKKFFGSRNDFEDLKKVDVKNMGTVKAWKKTYGTNGN